MEQRVCTLLLLFFRYFSRDKVNQYVMHFVRDLRRRVATPLPDIDSRRQNSLAKCLSEHINAQSCTKSITLMVFDDALGCNSNAHAYKHWCCGCGRPIHLYLRGHEATLWRANYSYYHRQHFLKLTINAMHWSILRRWVGYLYELSSKNGVCSGLQICGEQGWDHPHCKFQTNPLKCVPTALIRKWSFWPKI